MLLNLQVSITVDGKTAVLPGPAELDPKSPEADLRALFGDDYGDGSAIPLDRDDPRFAEKQTALKAAYRVWDRNKERWVRKA